MENKVADPLCIISFLSPKFQVNTYMEMDPKNTTVVLWKHSIYIYHDVEMV